MAWQSLVCASGLMLTTPVLALAHSPVEFNIEAQPLHRALKDFSEQAQMQLLYRFEVVEGVTGAAVVGTFDKGAALQKLLEGTGLEVVFSADDAATIRRRTERTSTSVHPEMQNARWTPQSVRLARANEESGEKAQSQSISFDDQAKKAIVLEEVVVTGSHIRGVEGPVGSPLRVYNSEEIKRSGAATAQQFIQSLTSSYGGDAASDDQLLTANGYDNNTGAVTINLRGLGASSTLILMNGRRLSSSGGFNGSFVDVSMIPLSAVERVEIMTDGASAIYGADAIAGVVNFVMKRDYEGAETSVRYGGTRAGGAEDWRVAQTFGASWDRGNALVAYEYYQRDRLQYSDRHYSAFLDKRPLGGDDYRVASAPGSAGNIISPVLAGIPQGQNGSELTSSDLLVDQPNLENAIRGADLMPRQERHNLFISARHELGADWSLSGDLGFTQREYVHQFGAGASIVTVPASNPYFVSPVPDEQSVEMAYDFSNDFGIPQMAGEVRGYRGLAALEGSLGPALNLAVVASYTREQRRDKGGQKTNSPNIARLNEALGFDNPATPFDPALDGYLNVFGDGSNTAASVLEYIRGKSSSLIVTGEVSSLSATFSGSMWRFGGRQLSFAAGVEARRETMGRYFAQWDGVTDTFIPVQAVLGEYVRDVSAAYTEFVFPLFDANNARPGLQLLQLSAAGRYERYDDLGSSTNPKLGMSWSPVRGMSVRASWGKSFKAPQQADMLANAQYYLPFEAQDPSAADGTTFALFLQGSNPNLKPERSSAWSAGIEIEPEMLAGIGLDLTYYELDFKDRIATLPNAFQALNDPVYYAPIIVRDPAPDQVQAYLNSDYVIGVIPVDSEIGAIIDNRSRNLSRTKVSGIDLELSHRFTSALGDWQVLLSGSYMLSFEQALTATTPATDVLNTAGHPVDLRLRSGLSWSRNGLSASLSANFLGGYENTTSVVRRKVDSWTTYDLAIGYELASTASGVLAGTTVSLAMLNALDESPPFFDSRIGYDTANADPLGRLVALTLSKKW